MPDKKEQLTAALKKLISASSSNSKKGKHVMAWFAQHYGGEGRSSIVAEQKQAYNRPDEQLRHDPDYAIFVVKDDATAKTLEIEIPKRARQKLKGVWILKRSSSSAFKGISYFEFQKNPASSFFRTAFPGMRTVPLRPPTAGTTALSTSGPGANVIFFGPPGTGKSDLVKKAVGAAPSFRTQFHPEYTHADFLGCYRPVVGWEPDPANEITGHDGATSRRPVNYFSFVPGPLLIALERAFGTIGAPPAKQEQVYLIIEEINRGDCAAIFGDAFQLLDRDENGSSEFGIDPKPEVLQHLKSKNINYDRARNGKLYLPPNLTLLATMNTSDQSLYPMDSAFKRRWQWRSCPLDFESLLTYTKPMRPFLNDGKDKFDWIKLLQALNKVIVRDRMEDKQIGPWFIKPARNGEVSFNDFTNKCLFYLWHDVFKDEQLGELSPFKSDSASTFGELQIGVENNGLRSGFKEDILKEALEPTQLPAASAAGAPGTALASAPARSKKKKRA